jgi:ABC-type transport system substrate-binding protein
MFVAACGGSDDDEGDGGGTPTTAAAESSQAAIPQVGDESTAAESSAAEETTAAEDTSAAEETTAEETTAEETTSGAAASTKPQGGRLHGLMESDINTWDGTDYYAYAWMVNFITCNTLVGYPTTTDAVKNLELRPEIASAMPEISEDGLTYTFPIRKGVKFSDGREVTPDDVKNTFLRMMDPKAAFQVFGTVYYDAIKGVPEYKDGKADDISGIVVDGDNVTFTLSQKNGGFMNALALQFACIVPSDAPHQKTNLPPPMTGPYMVTEHTQGKSLKIDRNPIWQDNVAAGLPVDPDTFNVDGFDITIGVPPDAQVLQIKNGQADFSFDQSCCVGAVANELANDPETKDRFFSVPSLRISYATFNVNTPPFDKPEVRQAVNFAVDREALVKILGGDIQASPTSGILADTMVPEGVDNNPYPATPDMDKAKALLEQAGVKTPVDAGTLYYPEAGVNADLAQQLVSDMKNVGINMNIKGLNTDNYYQFIQNPKNKDNIAIAGWEADYPDGITFFEPLLVSGAADGGSNYGDFKDPAFDAEVTKINEMPPGDERRAAYGKLSFDTSANQAPWITFYTRNNLNFVSPKYGGYYYGAQKTIGLGLAWVNP